MQPSKGHALLRTPIAVERHHHHDNSYKGRHLAGAGLRFRGLVCYDRNHGCEQAVMVEAEMSAPHLDHQAPGRETVSHWPGLSI